MATTEQRSGFRLPWASDARPGAPVNAQTPPEADPQPDAEGVTTADPTTAEANTMQDVETPDSRPITWPGAEPSAELPADDAAPTEASSPSAAATTDGPPARPRRENLLVTGLVRAMRDAAIAARQETAARFADEAKARVESIHAQAAEEAAELRKQADAEIVEIRDWSKAEMARIREETDQRIADRKQHLETEIERHGSLIAHRIERVETAIADFERQMETFFVNLLAEEDPARLAGLAEQLPEAPSLDLDDLDRSVPVFPPEVLDARGAAEAEAEAFASLRAAAAEVDALAEADLDVSDGTESTTDDDAAEALADDDVARRLDAFTSHPAGAEPTASRLAVVGLVSVASIAGFKRALAKSHGIRSVTVASGPNGDFVFTVTHDPETDLRSTVPALDGYAPVITGDADGVLTVTATDPDSGR